MLFLGGKTAKKTRVPRPQKRPLCLHDHKRRLCRRPTASQMSGPGPQAASSTLLPSASSQSSSKPTAVSMWVSLGHTPPLTFRSTPLLGSWTISASDPSYVPTLPSNVKTSTGVTPQNKVFPYTLLAYTTTSILELEPSQFQVSNHFCCIIHGPLATPWQHHVFLLVPKNG